MDLIKEAFTKIKNDINILRNEINTINNEVKNISTEQIQTDTIMQQIGALREQIDSLLNKQSIVKQTNIQEKNPTIPTQNISSISISPTILTQEQILEEEKGDLGGLKYQNRNLSIGNGGVPTNTPTNTPTNQHRNISIPNNQKDTKTINNKEYLNLPTSFERASQILESLDDIKKDIRKTFKQLTNQEMMVFSTLYTYNEQRIEEITYKMIANTLKLSESSIRDYINRLIKKGIPIEKRRLNNKKIILNVSTNLLEVTNLSTITRLRNL